MSNQYKVVEAACYVMLEGVGSVLLYGDAPVPPNAQNIDELLEGGFIEEVASDEQVGGHPSDLPPDYEHRVPGVVDGDTTSADSGVVADTEADQAPAKSASRADWDAYAKSQGLTDEEVAAFSSKEDLQKHFGVE